MSGAGRKHRAKHLTQQYLDSNGWAGLSDGETLGICLESPRGLHVRVLLLLPSPTTEAADDSSSTDPYTKEQLVFLPRKFHKVIWLSIKDVIVVVDGTIESKPSPEQLDHFMRDPENAAWRRRILAAQQTAETQRAAVQRMPQYGSPQLTTTSLLTAPQTQRRGGEKAEEAPMEAAPEDGARELEDELQDIVNPNWGTIKHQQQFFFDDADEEDDEDEVED